MKFQAFDKNKVDLTRTYNIPVAESQIDYVDPDYDGTLLVALQNYKSDKFLSRYDVSIRYDEVDSKFSVSLDLLPEYDCDSKFNWDLHLECDVELTDNEKQLLLDTVRWAAA